MPSKGRKLCQASYPYFSAGRDKKQGQGVAGLPTEEREILTEDEIAVLLQDLQQDRQGKDKELRDSA